ncbi:hypothetical protein BJV82DRAFT_581502 [Fennellomyces sp. T-0311]|nr:hypothetical protein BJV82DRAFT_692819 [Fennellomyces sp. T-0311]KAI8140234.1 hypothetical protein BJV82DRAFT_581502 [Fennellomyces sp. T-0311]
MHVHHYHHFYYEEPRGQEGIDQTEVSSSLGRCDEHSGGTKSTTTRGQSKDKKSRASPRTSNKRHNRNKKPKSEPHKRAPGLSMSPSERAKIEEWMRTTTI